MATGASSALSSTSNGLTLAVEVVPGASAAVFPAGWNPWRRTLQARVRAPPERGEANEELVGLVAAFFGVPASAVSVSSGHTSRRKVVAVRGLSVEAARERLSRHPNL